LNASIHKDEELGFVPLTESEQKVEVSQVPTIEYISLLKRFAVRLCVAVTVAVALLIAGEFYSYWRYLPAARDTMEPAVELELAERGSAAEREYWKEFEQANKVTYHPYVLWRRRPYQGRLLAIDENGVRRTVNTQCDDKTFTVWMFGDSVMWGAGSPDDSTIPSLVAADYQKAGKQVCIVNYAEKGWSSTQELIGLLEQLKHASRKPEVVLFYDGGTEAFTAYQSGVADVHSNYNGFKNYLDNWSVAKKARFSYLRETNTYHFLEKIALRAPFHARQAPSTPDRDVEALSEAVVQNYIQNMNTAELLAQEYGFRPIFAWYPNLAVGHKQQTPYEQEVLRMEYQKFPGLGLMYQAAYEKARKFKRADFHYLGDLLDDQKASLYVGISHLKPEGDQIVADRLFELLEHESSGSASRSRQ
jgi:hypothetical protein